MKKIVEKLNKNEDLLNVSVLLMLALCIGVYLIVTTAIIAKDGLTFIEYAKRFEIAPVKTMTKEFQHPGYPVVILGLQKLISLFSDTDSVYVWIYSAQYAALFFRLLTIPGLYFIGKQLFNTKMSFWGVLIFILLPKPAEYGSDALSDWPHLFFLITGVLLLFKGATSKRWWIFAFVGLIAGFGYFVRPECVQLIIVGGLWLGLQLLWSKHTISKGKALSGLALLLVVPMAIVAPYMNLKGAVFPKKNVGQFAQSSQQSEVRSENNQTVSEVTHTPQSTSKNIAKASYKLALNIGETLMWFFVPALLVGMYKWFKTQKWHEPKTFLVIAFIILNILAMTWLYCKYGYMSGRHTLPLLTILVLYVPLGLQELAIWLEQKFSSKTESSGKINRNKKFWFFVLLLIGVFICSPKLFRPIRIEKQGYKEAAHWLKNNTGRDDLIAVPDKRISFYAQRKKLVYEGGNIPRNAVYTVKLSKAKNNEEILSQLYKIKFRYKGKWKKSIDVFIYEN